MYVPDAWLSTTAGLHEPLIPLFDVASNDGTFPPAQMANEVPKLKLGTTIGFTITENVVLVAHWPTAGVNV